LIKPEFSGFRAFKYVGSFFPNLNIATASYFQGLPYNGALVANKFIGTFWILMVQ